MPEGEHLTEAADSIGRSVDTTILSIAPGSSTSITVRVRFRFNSRNLDNEEFELGTRTDTLTFSRRPNGKFIADLRYSTISKQHIQTFYNDLDSSLAPEDFLRFNLTALRTVATSTNTAARTWLRDYLKQSPPTPEANELAILLNN